MSSKILLKLSKLRYLAVATVCMFASCGFNLFGPASFARSEACDDVKFIFARGSGEPLGGPSMSAWRDEITAAIGGTSNNFKYSFYELGSQSQRGHQYPAVSVSDNFDGYMNLIGAYFSGGEAFRFGASVAGGIAELRAYIDTLSVSCPKTKLVLGGYSQGAMVLSGSLHAFDASKIIYVSTFGDPKLYLPEGKSTFLGSIPKAPDACRGLNLSPYRISVPDCRAYEGILGSYRPYQPEDYAGKLGTWCNEKDIMCSSGVSLSDHTSYTSSNLYRDAAAVIARKLALTFPSHNVWADLFRKAKHNVAFVVDTTISMVDVIDQYREEAKNLAARVKADGGDVALFEYRDLTDDFMPRKLCDFSCDLDEFSGKLASLEVADGGDIPESALSALLHTMNNLAWQPGATKSIVLLTDAIYHNPDGDGTTLKEVIQRSLEIDPVNIFVIAPSNPTVSYYYSKLTDATSGQVFTLGRTDLDYATDIIFNRPVARLALASYSGQTGDVFNFDASASYTSDGSELVFDWDLDGDGKFELLDATPIIRHAYSAASSHFIQVRVTDQQGRSSTMSAWVEVSDQSLSLPTISALDSSPQSDGNVLVTFQTDGERVLLATGELVRGFVEVKNGAGAFAIGDISDDLNVALTPYSSRGERGISREITISSAGTTSTPPAIQLPIPGLARPAPSTPKAPNTGLVSREYR